MRTGLIALFVIILLAMLIVTTLASLEQNILEAGRQLLPDRWFQATLLDAYCGFLTFYLWVAYKEKEWWKKIVWFLLIMALGNIAMSTYMLIRLVRLPRDAPLSSLLTSNDSVKLTT